MMTLVSRSVTLSVTHLKYVGLNGLGFGKGCLYGMNKGNWGNINKIFGTKIETAIFERNWKYIHLICLFIHKLINSFIYLLVHMFIIFIYQFNYSCIYLFVVLLQCILFICQSVHPSISLCLFTYLLIYLFTNLNCLINNL